MAAAVGNGSKTPTLRCFYTTFGVKSIEAPTSSTPPGTSIRLQREVGRGRVGWAWPWMVRRAPASGAGWEDTVEGGGAGVDHGVVTAAVRSGSVRVMTSTLATSTNELMTGCRGVG
jgi:hypothetical protein